MAARAEPAEEADVDGLAAAEPRDATAPTRTVAKNPLQRPVTQWLKRGSSSGHVAQATLTQSQRCGPQVTGFLSNWLPFARDYKSDPKAPQTELQHCYYDGGIWMSLEAQIEQVWPTPGWHWGAARSAPLALVGRAAVGWHTTLFNAIVTQLFFDIRSLRDAVGEQAGPILSR
ncbi:MAG: hypothetical protein GY772_28855 [bacterium]|nr:hypothetical protein [bacterium]